MMRAFIAIIILGLISSYAPAEETQKPEPVVYYGDSKVFNKPAAIEANKILESHPAYKKIREKKLKPTGAEYWLLMNGFNSELQRAVTKVAGDKGYDLIVEKGSTLLLTEVSSSDTPPKTESKEFEGEIPDITGLIIEELSAKK